MSDELFYRIKDAVSEGIKEYDKERKVEIEKMCEQNVEIALGKHRYECPGANKGNATGISSLGIGVSLIIERVFSYIHKGS